MSFQDNDQPPKRTCLGKIATAHGVKGLVKILPFGDDPSLLNGILFTSDSGEDTLTITLKSPLGKYMLAEIDGIKDRTAAEALRGRSLYVSRETLPEIEGHYFVDLIGRETVDEGGESVGKIIAVENYGASDLLEIQSAKGTFLIPLTDDFVPKITDTKITIKDYKQFL